MKSDIVSFLDTIVLGNNIDVMKKMPSESVHCVVTSPPYFGVRNYNTIPQEWGGFPGCKHNWVSSDVWYKEPHHGIGSNLMAVSGVALDATEKGKVSADVCTECGCWRGELGHEPTPEMFVAHLCDVFDNVKRVLRRDGTCFVNISDFVYDGGSLGVVPEMFCVEMVRRGWIKRNTIIWKKVGGLPQNLDDNFSTDFEYIYFFTVESDYFFEKQFDVSGSFFDDLLKRPSVAEKLRGKKVIGTRNKGNVWEVPYERMSVKHYASYPSELVRGLIEAGCPREICSVCGEPVKRRYTEMRFNTKVMGNRKSEKSGVNGDPYYDLHTSALTERGQMIVRVDDGYQKCSCCGEFEKGIVLDPFAGTGSTPYMARRLGRNFIGIELNESSVRICNERLGKTLVHPVTKRVLNSKALGDW